MPLLVRLGEIAGTCYAARTLRIRHGVRLWYAGTLTVILARRRMASASTWDRCRRAVVSMASNFRTQSQAHTHTTHTIHTLHTIHRWRQTPHGCTHEAHCKGCGGGASRGREKTSTRKGGAEDNRGQTGRGHTQCRAAHLTHPNVQHGGSNHLPRECMGLGRLACVVPAASKQQLKSQQTAIKQQASTNNTGSQHTYTRTHTHTHHVGKRYGTEGG